MIDAAVAFGGPLFVAGRATALVRRLTRVPRPVWRNWPEVPLHLTAIATLSGDPAAATEHLSGIGTLASVSPADRVVADLLHSRLALDQGDTATALAAAGRALGGARGLDDSELPDILGLTGRRDDLRRERCSSAGPR